MSPLLRKLYWPYPSKPEVIPLYYSKKTFSIAYISIQRFIHSFIHIFIPLFIYCLCDPIRMHEHRFSVHFKDRLLCTKVYSRVKLAEARFGQVMWSFSCDHLLVLRSSMKIAFLLTPASFGQSWHYYVGQQQLPSLSCFYIDSVIGLMTVISNSNKQVIPNWEHFSFTFGSAITVTDSELALHLLLCIVLTSQIRMEWSSWSK